LIDESVRFHSFTVSVYSLELFIHKPAATSIATLNVPRFTLRCTLNFTSRC